MSDLDSVPLEIVFVKEESNHVVEEQVDLMDGEDPNEESWTGSDTAVLTGLYTSSVGEQDYHRGAAPPPPTHGLTMEPRARATAKQYMTLVEFMERHGDMARGPPGMQGRMRSDALWQQLEATLNNVPGGVYKPLDKWKKVWADWKTKTKKKAFDLRKKKNAEGGGAAGRLNLMEKRVLAVMREAVNGHWEPDTEAATGKSTESQVSPRPPRAPHRHHGKQDDVPRRPAPAAPPRSVTRRFLWLEARRVRLEELRERNLHARETQRLRLAAERTRNLHARETQRLRLDAERTQLLRHLADLGQALLHHFTGGTR